ncbi:hypothetical protein with signal-peptide and transmembrane regions [Candidatus Nitrosarchaeum limnium SFB1]|jgi:hypothetical protein|uniref:Uncharacterized protein n=1 Tax=Candidatus Nitrosarchaeum limnium SFB1 TaxID=886738 RepID=F3KLM1_9ARCH|nr:hypothetical protein with signal-peptide and transmembrane regions [Candidatus Nitrosarchaeum limnium SFB1]
MKIIVLSIVGILFSVGLIVPSFAHTTVEVQPYKIEVGWNLEPPIVGIRNDLSFKITEPENISGQYKGVINAFKNLEATAVFGGVSKVIEIDSDPRIGYYFSPIIPTKTGTITINLKGDIDGVPIDVQIPVEDVESTAILDFPPTSGSSDQDVTSLKNAISSLQREVSSMKDTPSTSVSGGAAYDLAIFGLSIAAAAIILAIIALIKRK